MWRMLRAVLAVAAFCVYGTALAGESINTGTMYKSPLCGCCEGHAQYLKENGYELEIIETEDLAAIREKHGVPETMAGCHTIVIDGYVIEGHVPASSIDRLMTERPAIKGISLPGMPLGSPGMGGEKTEPFVVYAISEGEPQVFAVE